MQFPHTLGATRERLQSAKSPRMREILRVAVQEQEVLHRAIDLAEPHLAAGTKSADIGPISWMPGWLSRS